MKVKNQMFTHRNMHKNLSVPSLIKKALLRKEGTLTDTGALRVETGKYTGRSPKDRFIVKDDISDEHVDWGKVNQPFEEEKLDRNSTRLNSSHVAISYAVFCLKKKGGKGSRGGRRARAVPNRA